MNYFPNLNLGHTQFLISITMFFLCLVFVIFTSYALMRFINKRARLLSLFIITLILSTLIFILLEITVGIDIFRKIHILNNSHMPSPAICLEYTPAFSGLYAKYKVSPDVLSQWVEKYKLEEYPSYTFKSKMASNGQKIVAIYNPNKEILTIKYNSF